MSRALRPLGQATGALFCIAAIFILQIQRSAQVREARLRPMPFRIVPPSIKAHPEKAPLYAVEDLGVIGGHHESLTVGINASGQVVCIAQTPLRDGFGAPGTVPTRAFLWTEGRRQVLGHDITPTDINASGWIVGHSQGLLLGADGRPYRWVGGAAWQLLLDPERYGRAEGINGAGMIVGSVLLPGGGHRAFLWTDGTMQDLGTLGGTESIAYDVNADGEIVGASAVDLTDQRGFLWHRGQMRNLGTLGGTWSEATAISDAGQIVGASRTATDSDERACRWSHGVLQDLGTLPGCLVSRANDINHLGQVVGYSLPSGPRSRTSPARSRGGAFLYTDATGMVDLNTRIDPKSAWELDTATALNDAGQIVGNGRHRGRTRGFRLTPLIGEPRWVGAPARRAPYRRGARRTPTDSRWERSWSTD